MSVEEDFDDGVDFESLDDGLDFDIQKVPNNNYRDMLMVGSLYQNFKDLYDVVVEYAQIEGFNVAYSSHYFTDFQMEKEFGKVLSEKPLRNATFYCTQCKPSYFRIYVSFDPQEKKLKIRENGYQLSHNHTFKTPSQSMLITRNSELTLEESNKIIFLLKNEVNCYLIRKLIKAEYQKNISSKLIFNMKYKLNKEIYGANGCSSNLLEQLRTKVIENGGLFKFDFDKTLRLRSMVIMDSNMMKLCSVYSDVIVIDGTHRCSDSDMVVIAVSSIHPTGLNILLGIIVARSENSHDIINGMKAMNIKKKSTLITDEGGWYSRVASELQLNHILCKWHFLKKVEKYLREIPESKANEVRTLFNKVIFNSEKQHIYKDIEDLKDKTKGIDRFQNLINSFCYSINKLCSCFTNDVNTLGIQSTSRAESFNSLLKRFENISHFNLFQLLDHILKISDSIVQNIKNMEKKSIKNGISTYILKKIDEEAALLHHIKLRTVDTNNGKYGLHDDILQDLATVSFCNDILDWPTCSCPSFTKCRIICRHCIFVLNHRKMNPRSNEYLEPRWKLTNCPILSKATVEEVVTESDVELAEQFAVPDTEMARYSILKSMSDEIPSQFCKREDSFKQAVKAMSSLLNHTQENTNVILPILPVKRRKLMKKR